MRKICIGWTSLGNMASIAHTDSPEKLPVWLAKVVCREFKDVITARGMDQDIALLFRNCMLDLVQEKMYVKEKDVTDCIYMFNLTNGTLDIYSGKLNHLVDSGSNPFRSFLPESSTWCPEIPLLASAEFSLLLNNKDGMDRVRKELEESILGL